MATGLPVLGQPSTAETSAARLLRDHTNANIETDRKDREWTNKTSDRKGFEYQ